MKDQLDKIEKKVDKIIFSLEGSNGAIGLIKRVDSLESFVKENRVPAVVGRLMLYPAIGAVGYFLVNHLVKG